MELLPCFSVFDFQIFKRFFRNFDRLALNIFFLFSRNENFGKSSVRFQLQVGSPLTDLAEIRQAYCQIVVLENRVGDICVLFPFSNNRHFFKGSADDLSL